MTHFEGGDAWQGLVDAVAAAGAAVVGLGGDTPDIDIAEGLHYVLDVLGHQVDRSTLRASDRPQFLPGITPTRKLFFDNPDTDYETALLRGDRTYRIRGHRGTATYLAFCVYSGDITKGERTRVANLSDADMVFEPDGSFEITLSSRSHPGNWIPLHRDSHAVFARQYFLDRATEIPARYQIEQLGEVLADAPIDAAEFRHLARSTGAFVRTATALAIERADGARRTPNQFFEVPGHGVYGTPDAGYAACWYDLAPGESLAVELVPPPCRYWGVHLANRWGQSLDHRTRQTRLNARTATAARDGSVRVVIAPLDPGDGSWLDTAGHAHGFVLFRWLLADHLVLPTCTLGGK